MSWTPLVNDAETVIRTDHVRVDRLPVLDPEIAAEQAKRKEELGKPGQKGNRAASRRPRQVALATVSVPGVDVSSALYRSSMAQGQSLCNKLIGDLTDRFGPQPTYVLVRCRNASINESHAHILETVASKLCDSDNARTQQRAANLLIQASRLRAEARQEQVIAFGLAEKEAKLRASLAPTDVPWLVASDTDENNSK